MRSFILAILAVIGLQFAPMSGITITAAQAANCHQPVACGNAADIITWDGNKKLRDQIRVEVCHGYWDLLDPGTYRGERTKWWAAAMVYGEWYGDLPVVTAPCKTYWVKPGTELRLYAECVQRVISTGKMTKPGRYVMT